MVAELRQALDAGQARCGSMAGAVIAFSPVRQNPQVLELFLKHLRMQDVELWVYDDNDNPESSALLKGFTVLPTISDLEPSYWQRREDTHLWNVDTYHRVARIKNAAIDRFLATSEDALFLVDSDVLLQPGTVDHLDQAGLPILASVYWTRWTPDREPLPNMWGSDPEALKTPGHHVVGGLGACTLVRREVLERARFDPLAHLAGLGEDRWFCFRAQSNGYPLIMCSHFEPFHVYRDSELPAAQEWSDRVLNLQPEV